MTQPASSVPAFVAMSGLQLFEKACTVTIGSVQVNNIGLQRGLDVWFNVKRSIQKGRTNVADIRLYNMTAATRQAIASELGPQSTPVPVQIDAGYVGNTSTIFMGQLRNVMVSSQGPDYVIEIQAGDFDVGTIAARSTATFGTGATPYDIVTQLIQDMGCGAGNLASFATQLKSSTIYKNGYVLKGGSYEHLQDLAYSLGLEVTMQSGTLQWTQIGGATGSGKIYKLTSTTGLIGSVSSFESGGWLTGCLQRVAPVAGSSAAPTARRSTRSTAPPPSRSMARRSPVLARPAARCIRPRASPRAPAAAASAPAKTAT